MRPENEALPIPSWKSNGPQQPADPPERVLCAGIFSCQIKKQRGLFVLPRLVVSEHRLNVAGVIVHHGEAPLRDLGLVFGKIPASAIPGHLRSGQAEPGQRIQRSLRPVPGPDTTDGNSRSLAAGAAQLPKRSSKAGGTRDYDPSGAVKL